MQRGVITVCIQWLWATCKTPMTQLTIKLPDSLS